MGRCTGYMSPITQSIIARRMQRKLQASFVLQNDFEWTTCIPSAALCLLTVAGRHIAPSRLLWASRCWRFNTASAIIGLQVEAPKGINLCSSREPWSGIALTRSLWLIKATVFRYTLRRSSKLLGASKLVCWSVFLPPISFRWLYLA